MKDKLFKLLKGIYKKLPFGYKTKSTLQKIFYRIFGVFFKDTPSYRIWMSLNTKFNRRNTVKPTGEEVLRYSCDKKTAIQLHLYYTDLLNEFIKYFRNIPFHFDLLVSIVDGEKAEQIKEAFEGLKNVQHVYVETVLNRGRDVSPLVSVFGKRILDYDFICHVHSKKSLFKGGEQTAWRKYLLNALMGSEEIVRTNLYMLDMGENAGMLYPETYPDMPYQGHTWLRNRYSREELLNRIGVPAYRGEIYVDYPMGTMFWAKTDAIRQFFEADIKVEEFAEEAGQVDGTIAHAFERCLGLVCRYNGYNMLIVDGKEKDYVYNYGFKNMNQYLVKSYELMKLELAYYDAVSFDIFDTLVSRTVSNIHAVQKLTEYKTDASVEYAVAWPKRQVIEILKYVKRELHKEVYLICDTHLGRCDIERILEKCDITEEDYDELFLSSETDMRKDDGKLWAYYAERQQGKKCIHVGDDEVSDVQIPGDDHKIANYHLLSNKALFQLTDIGQRVAGIPDERAADAVTLGLILNSMFSDPLRYNKTCFQVQPADGRELGYNFLAPAVLYCSLSGIQRAESEETAALDLGTEIQEGIKDYIKDYTELMGDALTLELPHKDLALGLLDVADDMNVAENVKTMINYFKKELNNDRHIDGSI